MFEKPTLIITHSFPLSPDDYRGRFIADMLPRGGSIPVVVLTPDPEGPGVDTTGAVTIHRFQWEHGYLAGRRIYNPLDLWVFVKMLLIFVREATKIVRMYHISHLFACWAIPGGLAAVVVKAMTGIHYSVWALGTDINKFKRIPFLLRLIFRFADTVYANSEYLRGQMGAVTGRSIEILPTRSRLPEPVTPRKPLDIPEGSFVVAFVGRLERIKGIDRFLHIARRVRKVRPDSEFLVFGAGSLGDMVDDAVRDGTVLWAGQVTPGELAYYARRIDVLCITSREESMPVVVWEFKGVCPILSFAVGDIASHLPPEAILKDEEEFVLWLSEMERKGQ